MVRDGTRINPGRHSTIEKYSVPVRVRFSGGSEKYGLVFVRHEQRIIDLLCDARPFFPMQTKDNLTLISKANVSILEILQRSDFVASQDRFPPLDRDPPEDEAR